MTSTINSTKQLTVHLVDNTDEQGQPCEWCSYDTNTCIANIYIGDEGELHHSCWDCIPEVLENHTGDRPAVVELDRNVSTTHSPGTLPAAA